MNYYNEFEVTPELTHESPGIGNYAGRIWDIAREIHSAPHSTGLKNDYIRAAKAFGQKVAPPAPGGGQAGRHRGRQIAFYRRVIRNAANYLNKALLSGYRGPSHTIVRQAFNQASKAVARTNPPPVAPPAFVNTAATITDGPYRQTDRGSSSYTDDPAPQPTRPANIPPPHKRGKSWPNGAITTGGAGQSLPPTSQNHGRWTRKGNTILLHGLQRNTVYS